MIIDPKASEIIKSQLKLFPWTQDEKEKFLEALKLHGKDWDKVTLHVNTRSQDKIINHYHKMMRQFKKGAPSNLTELQTILQRLQ